MSWKKGPMPKGTYNWGAVTLVGQKRPGFYFADFWGDHAKICPGDRIVKAEEIAMYDNSLELPPETVHGHIQTEPK